MKNWIYTLAFSLSIVAGSALDAKIAVLDLQKAIQESDQGRKKRDELEKEARQHHERFQKRQREITEKMENLQKRQQALSAEVFQRREVEINQEWMQLQAEAREANIAIQQKEMRAMEPLIDGLSKVAEKVAKEKEKTIVIELQAVVWADSALDITDEVLKRFNKESK